MLNDGGQRWRKAAPPHRVSVRRVEARDSMTEAITSGGLHRTLGIGFGVAVSVGAMVGVGILRSPSLIADHAPDVFLIAALWLVGGMHALLDANVLAELAVLYPKAGGPYVYA